MSDGGSSPESFSGGRKYLSNERPSRPLDPTASPGVVLPPRVRDIVELGWYCYPPRDGAFLDTLDHHRHSLGGLASPPLFRSDRGPRPMAPEFPTVLLRRYHRVLDPARVGLQRLRGEHPAGDGYARRRECLGQSGAIGVGPGDRQRRPRLRGPRPDERGTRSTDVGHRAVCSRCLRAEPARL